MTEQDGGETQQESGFWLGEVEGIGLRQPGKDAEGPIFEVHGEEGMVAMEIADESLVEGLNKASAEMQLIFDEQVDHNAD